MKKHIGIDGASSRALASICTGLASQSVPAEVVKGSMAHVTIEAYLGCCPGTPQQQAQAEALVEEHFNNITNGQIATLALVQDLSGPESAAQPEAQNKENAPRARQSNSLYNMKTFIGIDGGRYGALAALYPDGTWEAYPVVATRVEETFLNVPGNYRLVELLAARAGGMDKILIVYERCRKNTGFGTRNNFVNGRHDEFWRVLLEAKGVPCAPIFPRTWQDPCLGRGGDVDTKVRALS